MFIFLAFLRFTRFTFIMEEAPPFHHPEDRKFNDDVKKDVNSNGIDAKNHENNGKSGIVTGENYLVENFSKDVCSLIIDGNTSRLKNLYDILSEVEDVEKGKAACMCLFNDCFDVMMKVVKNNDDSQTLKYYVWHFLQLMTCSGEAKQILHSDKDAIPLLLALEGTDDGYWNADELVSLKSISLNYILAMLANANDDYYEYIASTEVIPYFYGLLEACCLKSGDPFVELLLLGLNLLLEGSSFCKQQLVDLEFKALLSKRIEQRENCSENLLNVARQTFEKFVLLGSEHKSYVETFRYDFDEEVKKSSLYNQPACYNSLCKMSSNNAGTSSGMETIAPNFKRCSRCKVATYCSKVCQVTHWKDSHSKSCIAPS